MAACYSSILIIVFLFLMRVQDFLIDTGVKSEKEWERRKEEKEREKIV